MADEKMRVVWAIPTINTDGEPTRVYVGQVEYEGKLETAVRIDGGPTALIPVNQVVGDLLAAIRQTALKTYEENVRGEQS
ncbi:hypothetical protein [Amycolatopsis speibonae]|uniref:Uncharacterized protein n=1 Tax=Amycolatopsis speibonae TaxID=1450224 RepID=A0ABV7P4N6_9PSEU